MSWGVKITCFEAPGVSLGGSGVFIGGVRILRDIMGYLYMTNPHLPWQIPPKWWLIMLVYVKLLVEKQKLFLCIPLLSEISILRFIVQNLGCFTTPPRSLKFSCFISELVFTPKKSTKIRGLVGKIAGI